MKTSYWMRFGLVAAAVLAACNARAGNLTPPGAPGSTMKTLTEIEPRTAISSLPYTIVQSGSYYVTGPLSGASGIIISADNVTLDLGGFTLQGTGAGTAIGLSGSRTRLKVRNGSMCNWNVGVNFLNANLVNLEDLTVYTTSGLGIHAGTQAAVSRCIVRYAGGDGIKTGDNALVTDCMVANGTNSASGFILGGSCAVYNCVARNNAATGFSCNANLVASGCVSRENSQHGFSFGYGSNLANCSARENSQHGFQTASRGSTLSNCSAYNNTLNGFNLVQATSLTGCASYDNQKGFAFSAGCTFINCTASANSEEGFYGSDGVDPSSSWNAGGSVLQGCSSMFNTLDGIRVGSGCTIQGCSAIGNIRDGILLGSHNSVTRCTVTHNFDDGIEASSTNTLADSHLSFNGRSAATTGAGIHLTSTANTVDGNTCLSADVGIKADAASNLITRNRCNGNTTNYTLVANNKLGFIVAAPNSTAISGSTGGAGVGSTDPWANFSY